MWSEIEGGYVKRLGEGEGLVSCWGVKSKRRRE